MDKYLQYDHLDLSEDPSFIRWAKGSAMRDTQNWSEWLESHPEKADTVDKAKSIVLAMKFVGDKPKKGQENKIWDGISSKINVENDAQPKQKPAKHRLIRLLPYVAVAAVALIFLIFNLGSDFDTTVSTPFAMSENIILPDGSKVSLNADSKIMYDSESWDKKRTVFVEGEAFFSVEKGSRFIVKTGEGHVEVLGTSFNVYQRNDRLQVHCETGKVSVSSAGKQTILTPHQSVDIVNRQHDFIENVAEADNRSIWQKGTFVFKSRPLSEVVAELERQFDIKIAMDQSYGKESYTGSFRKSNIQSALTEVFYPLGLEFIIKGKEVTITK